MAVKISLLTTGWTVLRFNGEEGDPGTSTPERWGELAFYYSSVPGTESCNIFGNCDKDLLNWLLPELRSNGAFRLIEFFLCSNVS